MKNREKRLLDSVKRSTEFALEESKRTPSLRPLAERLAGHNDRLWRAEIDLVGTDKSQAGTGKSIRALRDDLRIKHMIPIARAGKKLLKFAPGVERTLVSVGKRAASDDVVRAARAMAKAVRPHRALFVEVGFAKDFLDPFKRMTDDLAQRALHWDSGRKKRTALLRTLADELRGARRVMDVLDAMLMDRMRTDYKLRLEWRMAKKVGPRMGRPLKRKATVGVAAG